MRKNMKLSSINIFRLVVVSFLICLFAIFLIVFFIRRYYHHLNILEYQEKNIYEIVTMYPEDADGNTSLSSYFMICDPPDIRL